MIGKTSVHQLVRFYQPWDVYTHHFVSPQRRTIEHVIPKSRLKSLNLSVNNDLHNLWMADVTVNQWRRDYRFAVRDDVLATPGWEQHMGCVRHAGRGLYCPAQSHRLIAHSIASLMLQYPRLEEKLDTVFDSPSCLDEWLATPWTDREQWMRIQHENMIEAVTGSVRRFRPLS
ncbi:hypothetical protein EBZ80_25210 [bacterium]|nr:hypothetical protein [bacterium]